MNGIVSERPCERGAMKGRKVYENSSWEKAWGFSNPVLGKVGKSRNSDCDGDSG